MSERRLPSTRGDAGITPPVFIVCWVLALMMSGSGLYFYYSYSRDARLLKALAVQLTGAISASDDKVRIG